MYNRQVVKAFLELGQERGFQVTTLILNDRTEDVDDRYIPRGSPAPRGFSRGTTRFGAAGLLSALRAKPDLVVLGHVHFARMARFLQVVSPGSRLWYLVYGIEVWKALPRSIRRGLALAAWVLSISEYSRQELARNGDVPLDRIGLLPCALDPVWQEQYAPREGDPSTPEGPPTILTVARLLDSERYKGVDAVIRALPEVRRRVPDVVYEVVGDGDDRPRLEALAREIGVADRVRFRGRVWPDELAAAYRTCTVFAMPSSKEGFGIVFLEAALFGKPSVGGNHGGTPEVVEEGVTGLLVEPRDIPGIAAHVVRLLTIEAERARMGTAARTRLLERFTYASFRSALGVLQEGEGA